jgi:hypothetical protein
VAWASRPCVCITKVGGGNRSIRIMMPKGLTGSTRWCNHMGRMPMPPQFQSGLDRPGYGDVADYAAKKQRNLLRFVRKAPEPPMLPTAAWTNAPRPRVNGSPVTAAGASLNSTLLQYISGKFVHRVTRFQVRFAKGLHVFSDGGERADDTVVEFNTIRLPGLRLSHRQLPLSDHTTEEPRAAH